MSEELVLRYVVPLAFVFCGIGLLAGGAIAVMRTRAFLAKSGEATGEVVALERESASALGESTTYRPVVSFVLKSGHTVQFTSKVSSNPPAYAVGQPVAVLYEIGKPHEARIRSFTSLWLLAAILAGLGLIFAGVGIALLLDAIPL